MNTRALFLLCEHDGIIVQVVKDSEGWTEGSLTFFSMLDPDSVQKAHAFMEQVKAEGYALGWELRLLNGERNETWEFCAFQTSCGLHLVAKPLADTTLLQTALSEINNDLVNSQRQLAQQALRLQQINRVNIRYNSFLQNLHAATQELAGDLDTDTLLESIPRHIRRLLPGVTEVKIIRHNDSPASGTAATDFILPLRISPQEEGTLVLAGALDEEDRRRAEIFATAASTALIQASLLAHIRDEAITDPLTGAYNRRGWSDLGHREVARVHRFRHPMSLIMLDIDHFKDINDTYGHTVGDKVLRNLARTLGECLREIDILGRYGGEEFIVLVPETGRESATSLAERLRKTIAEAPMSTDGDELRITISLGVATLIPDETTSFEELAEKADRALYQAKRTGRNRVVVV